ncbi:MAG TPA: isoprenylcysteine carboxylmethyltransferase family protein [Vicinamibacterales bacterium]|nr:isoprenylcysteine carboxylmethyltransferase family protein [Vicinamibacterales bacterium]
MMLVRQLLAIAILPFTMAVIIPMWIGRANRAAFVAPVTPADYALIVGGIAAAIVGLALFISTNYLFWTRGRGTLAPWDPPREFVAVGPYRYVRNPMISGVILIILAESLVWRSWQIGEWAAAFFVINLIYIPLVEQPMLDARFGASYREYKKRVRMFLPRLAPWQQ